MKKTAVYVLLAALLLGLCACAGTFSRRVSVTLTVVNASSESVVMRLSGEENVDEADLLTLPGGRRTLMLRLHYVFADGTNADAMKAILPVAPLTVTVTAGGKTYRRQIDVLYEKGEPVVGEVVFDGSSFTVKTEREQESK